jgi:hypothetical protein
MKKTMLKGFRAKPEHNPKVAVAFDNGRLFEKIKAMAEKENLTFGAMVCLKVVRRLASLT